MSVQLYVQYPNKYNNNPWTLLDIKADEEPIKLTLSVADIADPLKVASTYSRSFRIPHTQVNGAFFKAVFDVNGVDFNPAILAPSYINDNGETLVLGNIRLTGIYREDQSKGIWYEVLFMGETSDFSSNINGFYMSDLDMTKYNHSLNLTNITNSWSGGLFNGAVRYPLVEWGYTYAENATGGFDPVQPTLSMLGTSGKSFTNSGYPLRQTQMKPAIQLKALWDAIIAPGINQVGYATNSSSTITIPTFPVVVPSGFYQMISLTLGTGLSYTSTGTQEVIIQFDDNNYMKGNVILYTSVSGFTQVNITEVVGSGTYNSWAVTLIQPTALSGYTYTSTAGSATDSFMNSTLFKNLYVLTDSVARPEFIPNQKFSAVSNFVSTASAANYFMVGTTTNFDINQELIDEANAYNPATSTYITPSGGGYVFKVTFDATVDIGGGLHPNRARVNIILRNSNTGQTYQLNSAAITVINIAGSYVYTVTSGTIPLAANQPLQLQIQVLPLSSAYGGLAIELNSVQWETLTTPVFVNISSLFSNQIKLVDFVKGVIDKFKLVFIPSKEKSKEFQIIPWINWVQGGKAKDWTGKLDESVEYKISPLFNGQTRNNVFRDNEDTDYLNYNYQQANNKTYGQLNIDSGNLLLNGETVRQNIFARTPLAPIGVASGATTANAERAAKWLIPHLAKITSSGSGTTSTPVNKVEPIQPKLRMVFWNGMQDRPAGSPNWYLQNDFGAGTTQDQYPLVSDFQTWPLDPSTLDLRWSYAPPLYDTTVQTITNPTAFSNVTAFNQYWKGWYDTVQDIYNRSVEMTMILNYADIKDLLFNDYIYVKDAWYFVDSISDYVVGKTTSCKVKLYKVGNTLGIVLPNGVTRLNSRPACYHPTSDCGAVCCTNGSLSATNYFTSVTGAPAVFSTRLYTDPFGNIPAPAGKYSIGGNIWTVGSGGLVTVYTASPFCACGNTGGQSQRALYVAATPDTTGTLASNVLCNNPVIAPQEVAIYGQQTDTGFAGNVRFFQDTDLTIPVADGIYYPIDEAGESAWTVNETQVWQIVDKGMCDCASSLYEHNFGYGPDDCKACCFTVSAQAVWSDTEFVAPGSNLYYDALGTQPVIAGFWSDGGTSFETDGSGLVINETGCDGCTCGDVTDIVLNYSSGTSKFNGRISLEKSFDLHNWFFVGYLDWPFDQPVDTTVSTTFQVETNAWTRASAQTDIDRSGAMTLAYIIDAVDVQVEKVPTPYDTYITITSQDQANPGPIREYTATVYG